MQTGPDQRYGLKERPLHHFPIIDGRAFVAAVVEVSELEVVELRLM